MAREICGECKYNKYSTTEKEFIVAIPIATITE